jgi:hypothetical protein
MDFVNDFVNGGACDGGNALRSFVHTTEKGYEPVSNVNPVKPKIDNIADAIKL